MIHRKNVTRATWKELQTKGKLTGGQDEGNRIPGDRTWGKEEDDARNHIIRIRHANPLKAVPAFVTHFRSLLFCRPDLASGSSG